MQDRALQLFAVTLVCLILTWITVPLRCFVRARLNKSFGLDGWFMVASLFVFTILCGILFAGVHYGMGSHNIDVSASNFIQATKYQTLAEIIYVVNTATIKLSIGFLLLRICPLGTSVYRYVFMASMAAFTVGAVITFFVLVFQCYPVSYTWDQTSGLGTCLSRNTIANFGYGFSALDILFDWLYALLPIPMLWDVKMTFQIKLSIFAILGLGVFASTATIIRLKYIVALVDPKDYLYSFALTLVWTVLENGIAITAASIAVLRPLFARFHIPGFTSSAPKSRQNGGTHGYERSYDLNYITNEDRAGNTKSTITHTRRLTQATSQESILGGIQKKTEVEVTYDNELSNDLSVDGKSFMASDMELVLYCWAA